MQLPSTTPASPFQSGVRFGVQQRPARFGASADEPGKAASSADSAASDAADAPEASKTSDRSDTFSKADDAETSGAAADETTATADADKSDETGKAGQPSEDKTEDGKAKGKTERKGSIVENAKVGLALVFNVVLPIALAFSSSVLPLMLLTIPLSYVSGKIGRRILSGLDDSELSGIAATTKELNDIVNKGINPKDLKDLSEDQQADYRQRETEHRLGQLDAVIDRLTDDVLSIKFLSGFREPIKKALHSPQAQQFIRKFFRNKMLRNMDGAKGNAKFLLADVNTKVAGSKSLGEAVKNGGGAAFRAGLLLGAEGIFLAMGRLPGPFGKLGAMLGKYFLPMVMGADIVKGFMGDDDKAAPKPTFA